jgi:inosose dehydratase
MQLAFSRPTSNEEEQQLLFDQFQSIGYEGLQLKLNQYKHYIDRPELFLEKWGHIKGVASGLITYGILDENHIAQLKQEIRFAQKVKSERIILCHTIPRQGISKDDFRGYATIISDLGKEAEQSGVEFSLHHHYNQPVMYKEDMDVFFDQINDDSVGLTIDTAHLVKSGIEDISDVIYSFRDVIDNFHIKDYVQDEFKVLGQGEIDFAPIFQAIKEIEYNGWITADEESGYDINEGMKDCYEYMKERTL